MDVYATPKDNALSLRLVLDETDRKAIEDHGRRFVSRLTVDGVPVEITVRKLPD